MMLKKVKPEEKALRKSLLVDLQESLKGLRKDTNIKQAGELKRSSGGIVKEAEKRAGDDKVPNPDAGGSPEHTPKSAPKKEPKGYADGGVVDDKEPEDGESVVRNSASDDNPDKDGRPVNEYESFAPVDEGTNDLDAQDDSYPAGDIEDGQLEDPEGGTPEDYEGDQGAKEMRSLEEIIRKLSRS